jgi:hypothetical protein
MKEPAMNDLVNVAVEAHGGYRAIDGIMFPTTRRVYPYEGDYQRVKEPLLVDIKMREITLAYSSDARETQPL